MVSLNGFLRAPAPMIRKLSKVQRQTVRFALVGLASNVVFFLAYLFFTAAGVEPKTAMTIVYVSAVGTTFLLNRQWTFAAEGRPAKALVRYVIAYVGAYLLNLAGLLFFVDRLGWRHDWTQGALIFVVAAMLFLAQKYWVFRPA